MKPLRSTLVLGCAITLTAGAIALADGAHAGLLTGAMLLAAAAPVLAVAHYLARRRDRLGSLQRQFAFGITLAFGLVLLTVGGITLLMIVEPGHAATLGALLAFAGVLATWSAMLVSRGVRGDVQQVRDALLAVGAGEHGVRVETGASDELAELAGAANRMIGQLAEREAERDASEAARGALIAAVSHDLRTPLASLQAMAEAVEDGMVDAPTRRRYLRQMSVHVHALSALIEDLFELSRLEAGNIEWTMRQVQLEELLRETVDAMRPEAESKAIRMALDIPGELAPAAGNPEKLQRVLFNLIQNAIRHTPSDGSVTVRAESSGALVEVEVADTGPGLSAGDRARAFEPFYRGGREAARTRSGAGLGLTICQAIVEAHGGDIWIPECERGTRVRFSVPKA